MAIQNGASVFMNIGTTTQAVGRELMDHESLSVVTNNMNIATIQFANLSCEIILAGGTLRRADGGIVGGLAADMVKHFKFDVSVLGCSAIDADGDFLDFDGQEVLVSQAAIEQPRKVMLVADHIKFQRKAPLKICSLQDVDLLFTDSEMSDALLPACQMRRTAVEVA